LVKFTNEKEFVDNQEVTESRRGLYKVNAMIAGDS
jgi:hypothetical protein